MSSSYPAILGAATNAINQWDISMPARIDEIERRVLHIAIAIEALRIARIGDQGIGLREAAKLLRIPSRIVVGQVHCGQSALAGEVEVGLSNAAKDQRRASTIKAAKRKARYMLEWRYIFQASLLPPRFQTFQAEMSSQMPSRPASTK